MKAEQRVWIEYIAGLDFVAAIDRPKVSYDDGVYSLSIASFDPGPNGLSDWDKAQQTSLYGWATTGVAVGLWRRVRWENFLGYAQARVPLTGMPRDLMARLESELGRTIEVRWRWSGAGKPKTLESGPMMGFISTNTWLVPNRLRLEFVEAGEVVWTFE